ncbi:uncharacterized protein LOC131033275 [Cryptomeria japonica]|uniref:uncharacterized protein LOC131033275 n=1 Tax=Cryptomeria japonica TaxID=3369 RepID=UPI0027DA2955|nr:uncharacterized protein LOC131033275 [Cryptomeria japonica]
MWQLIICGVLIYKFVRFLISEEESGQELKFMVGSRLEKLYGGRVFYALRIPDEGSGTRQSIDIVLLTKRELSVIAIRNFAGILDAASDGSWSLRNSKGQFEKIPNLVEETRIQAAILESYLERRGVILPAGYLSCKVILANSDCRALPSVTLHQEVLSYDKWMQLKEESRGGFREWLRHMFSRVERDVSDKIDKKLRFILSTSPAWDRLELKGSQQIYGEFLGFKGKKEDVDALKVVKRSKVAKIVKYKPIMFDLLSGGSTVHLFCIPRDYRNEGTSEVERTEVSVRAGTEVVFQPMDAKKAQQFKVKKIACLSLSP